ncbi:MAG: patatin-like phospholipase family protein [Flavobacteriales bacterium]|nr:patatin-like phospholipase family protein [Flavobacteriales bacterium]MCB9167718.1 patatin-like phospholipase family protein [Flavobacteriales bacterium]
MALLLCLPGLRAQRVGLVLSGGGASALAHIGVMEALEESGVPIDFITGSSMGALVGALYASGLSPWQIDSLFRTVRYQTMAQGGITDEDVMYFKNNTLDASLVNVKIDLDTLLQYSLPTNLRSPALLDLEQMNVFAGPTAAAKGGMDSLFVPFRCVASDITAQRMVVFDHGDLAQAVRASMSYPFYYKPIRVHGHLMMDGGLYNNFPSDVMYDAFFPDIIIGSNVSSNSPPPSEDDLLSQLKAMLQEPTNYSVLCENGIIIEPRTDNSLFDISDAARTIRQGYSATMARMPEIKAAVGRNIHQEDVAARRVAYRAKLPDLRFGRIQVDGSKKAGSPYVERVMDKDRVPQGPTEVERRYFRLYQDVNVSSLYPRVVYIPERGDYDLHLQVKPEKDLEAQFGGLFSSRPINTGMVGLRYNLFGRSSSSLRALSYFGKFYSAGQVKLRTDLPSSTPIYLEPVFTIHRWDFFRSFATFFDEVKPSYIVVRETWAGMNAGMGLGMKGLLRADVKYGQNRDSYYQTQDFAPTDTADVTEYFHVTGGLILERNSLNRKQHPNAGECLRLEVRYIGGEERTTPGSTNTERAVYKSEHDQFLAKVTLDKYFIRRGVVRFGGLLEGVYSNYPFFKNYTATMIRCPAFQPTPESRTYFLENFRAPQFVAGGIRAIMAVWKERFDLRLEAYAFQPYEAIVRGPDDAPRTSTPISDRAFLASGSLIYQSPIGPIWFNTSYVDGLATPWQFSLNFGYVIFAQRIQE